MASTMITQEKAQERSPVLEGSDSSTSRRCEAAKAAPGWPGLGVTWSSGAKSGVGTALNPASSVWFTISQGILTEVYYPYIDTACTRDLELLVTDRRDFFAEEKRDTRSEIAYLASGVPAYQLVNTCLHGRFRIEKQILADPFRSTILQRIHFHAIQGQMQDYAVFVLLSPRLGNQGANTAWIGEFKGLPMLFARQDGTALALACSVPWKNRSAGFVGISDGWQDVLRHKQMCWHYERAEDGNVALAGEVDLDAAQGQFLLLLSFGRDESEAGHRAGEPVERVRDRPSNLCATMGRLAKGPTAVGRSEKASAGYLPHQRHGDADA